MFNFGAVRMGAEPEGFSSWADSGASISPHGLAVADPNTAGSVVQDDAAKTSEDAGVNIAVLANDTPPPSGVLGLINGTPVAVGDVISLPSGATVTVLADGTLDYNPGAAFQALNGGQTVTDSFSYQLVSPGLIDASGQLNVTSLNGANGFRVVGVAAGDNSGGCVAGAGDVNGDGIDDFIVGSEFADPHGSGSGASYVVFGRTTGFPTDFQLSSLNGANGFKISGKAAGDSSGGSVASAGDLNGDGFGDIIVGAEYAAPHGAYSGASYVVFGKASGFAANLDLSTLDGVNGFQISGERYRDYSCRSAVSAGDVNGDGIDDLVVGASGADDHGSSSGVSYVIFGKTSGYTANLDLSSLNGTNGFQLNGALQGDHSGRSVDGAGDVNGDGFDDLIIGTFGANPNGTSSGTTYVVFGKATPFPATLELSSLNGLTGFKINGEQAGDYSGRTVSAAGDINGDGFADMLIGARLASRGVSENGAAYVVFGKASGFSAVLQLSALDGTNGFEIDGLSQGDRLGISVGAAGDINGDGFDDFLVSAPNADPNGSGSGATYLIYGKATGYTPVLDLNDVIGAGGFQINGAAAGDVLGVSVSGAGDVNGDGYDDLIVGADHVDINGEDSGASYIIYGGPNLSGQNSDPGMVTISIKGQYEQVPGSSDDDTLTGGGLGDELTGLNGADTLNGGSGDDLLSGGKGNDVLRGDDGIDTASFKDAKFAVTADLGTGVATNGLETDTLVSIENLVGSKLADALNGYQGTNALDGGGGNDTLNGFGGNDLLFGGKGDDILIGGAGADVLTGGADHDTFRFALASHSNLALFDTIADLSSGDLIDLALIDADTATAGDQAFRQVAGFTGHAGELTLAFDTVARVTTLLADVNGDGTADLKILIAGSHTDSAGWLL